MRGETVMRGYLDDPDATAAAIDADGWLHTGDLGTIDADGYLRIVGRIKDMFIVGGFNAYPAEIENLLLRHPRIAQVAVIGVPDERLGEVGMAFVVLDPGPPVEPAEIIEWARGEMANFKVPRARRVPRRAAGERDRQGREGRAAGAGGNRLVVTAHASDREQISGVLHRLRLDDDPDRTGRLVARDPERLGGVFDREPVRDERPRRSPDRRRSSPPPLPSRVRRRGGSTRATG